MTEKRLAILQQARRNSEEAGDLASTMDLNQQIVETEDTLRKLRTLQE